MELVACAAGGLLRPAHFSSPLWVYLDPVVLYFLAGLIIGRWVCDRATRTVALRLGGLVLLWTLDALLRSGAGGFAWHLLLRPVLVTLVVVLVVVLEPVTRSLVPAVLVYLGDASYSLYLFHPFIGPVIPLVLARLHLVVPWLSVLLILAACSAEQRRDLRSPGAPAHPRTAARDARSTPAPRSHQRGRGAALVGTDTYLGRGERSEAPPS